MAKETEKTILQLTATMQQFAGHLSAMFGHLDRVATLMNEMTDEMRSGNRSVQTRLDALEPRIEALGDAAELGRREMNERFAAIGRRFDDIDVRIDQLEAQMTRRFVVVDRRFDSVDDRIGKLDTQMRALHSDVIHMEIKVINATQAALQTRTQLGELRDRIAPSPDNPPDPS